MASLSLTIEASTYPKDKNEDRNSEFSVTITLGLGRYEHVACFRSSFNEVRANLSFIADRLKVQLREQARYTYRLLVINERPTGWKESLRSVEQLSV